jgi:ABC-type multidrug transport system, ATPase component
MALTLSRKVDLYLLDEPFNGIDSMTRKSIVNSIIAWKPENATILISDHHVSDISNILDQVVVIKDKTVVDHKDTDEIREKNQQSLEEYYESFYIGGKDND